MFKFWGPKIDVSRKYPYDRHDIAVAFMKVATKRYGKDALQNAKITWVSKQPRMLTTIKVSHNDEVRAMFGAVEIHTRSFSATFSVCADGTREVYCITRAEYQQEAEAFLKEIEEHLRMHSIYKGSAIAVYCSAPFGKLMLHLDFLNLSDIQDRDLVYNEEVYETIRAHLWTLIEKSEECAAFNIRRQRKILLEGPYGSGKTLTALLTARKAIAHGWSFFYLSPTTQSASGAIAATLELARTYQPAVIFIEDIDHEQRSGESYTLKQTLSALDGLKSKSDEIITVMTANRSDHINGALQRPGRIDKIIKMGVLTARDIQRMITSVIPDGTLDADIKWDEIAAQCRDYPPAFVREVGMNALLSMISRSEKKVTHAMLVRASRDLRDQFQACAKSIGFQTKE